MTAPMEVRPETWVGWSADEIAHLDAIIRTRPIFQSDAAAFPNRTVDAVRRQASKRRLKLGLAAFCPGRPRESISRDEKPIAEQWAASSDALHRATVRMCIRRGITLPGLSPAHTRAIAVNLGIAA